MLVCPKCKNLLERNVKSLQCCEGHCYDYSKHGYLNLLLGNHKATGDNEEMVKARTNFLNRGYYQNLCDELISIINKLQKHSLVDAGCGEGYYTNQIADSCCIKEMYGFDLSKYAIDMASRKKRGVQFVVSSVFDMPLQDKSIDMVLSVFAPIKEKENARILKEGGYFIKVGPGAKHLHEMKQILYKDIYDNERMEYDDSLFKLVEEKIIDYEIVVNRNEDINALFMMTPYYWKSPKETSTILKNMKCLTVRIQFHIEVFQKR